MPGTVRARMPRGERRAQLLTVAERLFSDHGYHHITMDDIADGAGVSKPVLYRHFPSKLDLYLALVDQQGAALVDSVRTVLTPFRSPPPGTSPADVDALAVDGLAVIEAIVRAYVDYARSAGPSAGLLFESDVMRDPDVRARVLEPDEVNAREFAVVLGRLTTLTAHEALVVARTCTAIARNAAGEAARVGTDVTDEELTRLVPALAWRGVHGMLRRDR
ncbi:TetR/AcrR family transcriptional regulator [Oerskovia turbata]|uniref:TetR/AcrR family transcriptional regulator n=2 Tax=Oerskovia turbata TaxID=1713 RepID=A0A4Q1L0K3_9CELL|nr:TetR/AcrR family transcriptional regulator [Oerskovia turbata]RXR36144.1 TetR/AcrR family transcriptional regulator [Oerskovia turbata]TGJ94522.1 TetR/AcrR family transcriptional regulator [Actinotalea fermentans ATCC 43279 = JCM 9966 = DSM 3133]